MLVGRSHHAHLWTAALGPFVRQEDAAGARGVIIAGHQQKAFDVSRLQFRQHDARFRPGWRAPECGKRNEPLRRKAHLDCDRRSRSRSRGWPYELHRAADQSAWEHNRARTNSAPARSGGRKRSPASTTAMSALPARRRERARSPTPRATTTDVSTSRGIKSAATHQELEAGKSVAPPTSSRPSSSSDRDCRPSSAADRAVPPRLRLPAGGCGNAAAEAVCDRHPWTAPHPNTGDRESHRSGRRESSGGGDEEGYCRHPGRRGKRERSRESSNRVMRTIKERNPPGAIQTADVHPGDDTFADRQVSFVGFDRRTKRHEEQQDGGQRR